MPCTFTLPADALARLARLHLATDSTNLTSVLAHIQLRITAEHAHFAATNGKLLAVLQVPISDFTGNAADVILDVRHLADAIRSLDRALPARSAQRITCEIGTEEARWKVGSTAALIALRPGTYPAFDHIFTRTTGQAWVPCLASLDPDLVTAAQKIVGKPTILFWSNVPAESPLMRVWEPRPIGSSPTRAALEPARNGQVNAAGITGHAVVPDVVPESALASLVSAPAYYSDHQLAILLMPITRTTVGAGLNLERFVPSSSPEPAGISSANFAPGRSPSPTASDAAGHPAAHRTVAA